MHSIDLIVAGVIVVATWLARKSSRMLRGFIILSAIAAAIGLGFILWTLERHGIVGIRPYSHLLPRLGAMLTLLSILSLNFLARAPRPSSETRGA